MLETRISAVSWKARCRRGGLGAEPPSQTDSVVASSKDLRLEGYAEIGLLWLIGLQGELKSADRILLLLAGRGFGGRAPIPD
jgi:hypothetical protein